MPHLIEDATYDCYVYNRKRTPGITPEEWGFIFPDALEYEDRLQGRIGNGGERIRTPDEMSYICDTREEG